MTTFNFSDANGTLLNAISGGSNWAGNTSTLNTQSGVLQSTAAFTSAVAYFSNGQANTQSVQALFKFYTAVGGELKGLTLQNNGTQAGYRIELRQDGDIDVTRNGVFQTRLTGGGALAADITMKVTYVVGTGVVEVFTAGTSRGTFTDGTPLTGGYPGLVITSDSNAAQPAIDDWTDFVTASPILMGQAML